jgi:energy-coupling factor transporter ATP-binding protein EcfA2
MIWRRGSHQSKVTLGSFPPHFFFNRLQLTEHEQRYHGLVVGKSGSGKSKLLQWIMQSYIQHSLQETRWLGNYSSHGATVLEPHHDLSFDILTSLVASGFYKRPDAFERVVYLDFGNDHFVPFNVLEGGGDPHIKASLVLDAMFRIYPELQTAPTFTELFESGVVVLIANNLPLTALHRLYTDRPFRQRCLKKVVADEAVAQTFTHFEELGRDQAQEAGSTIRRAFQLIFNPTTRLSLGQPDNRLPFRQWMDEGRFVILNLGGVRDSLSRKILGAMLMVQLEQAALSRTDLLPQDRVQHSIVVDEWPTFAATEESLGHILSQARKFGLNIYLACQSLSQISDTRLSGAFENCKLGVFFSLGHDSAEVSSRQIGDFDPHTIKKSVEGGDFTLTGAKEEDGRSPITHDQYMPILEQVQLWMNELKGLNPRHCYVKVDSAKAVKIRTPMVPSPRVDKGELESVLQTYRQKYQRTQEEAEKQLQGVAQSWAIGRDDKADESLVGAFDWNDTTL